MKSIIAKKLQGKICHMDGCKQKAAHKIAIFSLNDTGDYINALVCKECYSLVHPSRRRGNK